ncbi:class IV adenylate cyclase [archaeon]|nr:class IV adenylate cyclase [archaeon]
MTETTKEIEIKIEINDFKTIKKQLKTIGAKNKGLFFEKNIIFDKNNTFKKNDCLLRIRSDKKTTMCYKGPREKSDTMQIREEIEFEISNLKKAILFIERLGFKQTKIYEKKRETWQYKNTEIVLDELPFGKYIEIEGLEQDIKKTANLLGFKKEKYLTKTYFELAEEKGYTKDIIFNKNKTQ